MRHLILLECDPTSAVREISAESVERSSGLVTLIVGHGCIGSFESIINRLAGSSHGEISVRTLSRTCVRTLRRSEIGKAKPTSARGHETVLVVSPLGPHPEKHTTLVGKKRDFRYLFQADDLSPEAIASRLPQYGIRDNQRVHISSRPKSFEDILYRTLAGITQRKGPERIVDAWLEESDLVLLSPNFERMHVPLVKLEKFIGRSSRKVKRFEIDDDGSFLYWPHSDTHLGWEQFRQIIDPAAAVVAKQRSTEFNEKYGAAIRAVRNEYGLTQAEIKGVTDRNLRRVEKGEIQVSKKVLESLAKAHGLPLDEYLKVLADQMKDMG